MTQTKNQMTHRLGTTAIKHGKIIDVKNISLYRWIKHISISRAFFLVQENINEKNKMKFLLKQ